MFDQHPSAEALDVIMPVLNHRILGRLRPVTTGEVHGAVLFLTPGLAASPVAQAICDEIDLYLHARGLLTLRVAGETHLGARQRARELLAGVTFLLSCGVRQVVLVLAAEAPLAEPKRVSAETLADLLEELGRQDPRGLDILRAVQSMVSGIRIVCDSVVGVATILPERAARVHAHARQRQRQRMRLLTSAASSIASKSQTATDAAASLNAQGDTAPPPPVQSPPALLLALPEASDAAYLRRRVAQVSRLYSWVRELLEPAVASAPSAAETRLQGSPHSPATTRVTTRVNWQPTVQWMEDCWLAILQAAYQRLPDDRMELQRLLATATATDQTKTPASTSRPGAVQKQVQAVWHALDQQARVQWLQVSHIALTRLAADTTGKADPDAQAISIIRLAQTRAAKDVTLDKG